MTIDEAIKHCEDVENGKLCEGTVNHKACGEEHKQLGIWLEELKELKEQKRKNALYSKIQQQNVTGLEDDEPECPNCGEELDKCIWTVFILSKLWPSYRGIIRTKDTPEEE